jgi:hypothetical protein
MSQSQIKYLRKFPSIIIPPQPNFAQKKIQGKTIAIDIIFISDFRFRDFLFQSEK